MNQEEGKSENHNVNIKFHLYAAVEFYPVMLFISCSKHVVITRLHIRL